MSFLYHYTDKYGAEAIRASMTLRESKLKIGDAVFGEGVYFTKMSPQHHSKVDIVMNNWGADRKRAEEMVSQGTAGYVVKVSSNTMF